MQLSVSILGLFVSFLVLINIKTSNKANYYLVAFLILINLFNVMNYSTMLSDNVYLVAIFKVHFMPLVALTGPSLYLYIRSLLKDDARLQRTDIIHIVPALLLLINNYNYYFHESFSEKLSVAAQIIGNDRSQMLEFDHLLFSAEVVYYIRSILAIIYMIMSSVIVYQHYKVDFRKQFQNVLIFRWLILLLIFTYIMNFAILYYVVKLLQGWSGMNKMLNISVGWYIYAVGSVMLINLILFFFPSILYGLPRMDYKLSKTNFEIEIKEDVNDQSKIVKDFEISTEKLELIAEKLKNYATSNPFISPNFNLTLMSIDTKIPKHHISYFFKVYLNSDFTEWKNKARIEYVISLIKSGEAENLTLDAISKKAGFVSRSTFINAFKSQTGKTPSEYF